MPTGLRRYQQQGHQHFLTISCDHKKKYFDTAAARDVFEQCLERSRAKYGFAVLAYVVMPNHVHLLVSEPPRVGANQLLLSVAIQSLKIGVAKRLPHSPFWNRRYYDFNVYSEKKWVEKVDYIHRNPVKWGLVNSPEDWAWSSANTYKTLGCGVVRLESFYQASLCRAKLVAQGEVRL